MTSRPSDLVAAVLGRLDWLSNIGANALRAVVIVLAAAIVAFWIVVANSWGAAGFVIAAVALVPGVVLWWYARALSRAVDRAKIELSVNELIEKTASSVGEAMEARRLRFGLIRAGWRAVTRVRELRDDLERLGVDLAAWAIVGNPGTLLAAGISVLASGALTIVFGLGIVLKLVF